jgi:hypothetical protein
MDGVFQRFTKTEVHVAAVEHHGISTQLAYADHEGHTRARRRLVEQQRHGLRTLEWTKTETMAFHHRCQIKHRRLLFGREVVIAKEVANHCVSPT